MELCSYCQTLDFRDIGYYRPPPDSYTDHAFTEDGEDAEIFENRLVGDEEDDERSVESDPESDSIVDNETNDLSKADSAISQNDDEEQDSETEDNAAGQILSNVFANEDSCKLCSHVSSTVKKIAAQHWGGIDKFDLRDAMIRYDASRCMIRQNRPEDKTYEAMLSLANFCILNLKLKSEYEEKECKTLGMLIGYQRCRDQPESVTELCDRLASSEGTESWIKAWQDIDHYRGRMRPQQADMRLFKGWKELCNCSHSAECQSNRNIGGDRNQTIRFIDVVDMCLVERSGENSKWVALSYVWGSERFRTLIRKDFKVFHEPGALSAPWVPPTIQDAMEVTRGLGERYLWVDSFCIIQDSDDDKAIFIPLMATIYGLATVTIVDMAGTGAYSGLKGVRPYTRAMQDPPLEINGTWLMTGPPPSGLGFVEPYLEMRDVYMTRAWTFQEMMLSQRLLIFTPEIVFWECRQATWREDSAWEVVDGEKQGLDIFTQSVLRIGTEELNYSRLWSPKIEDFDRVYQSLVYEYSKREMSHDGDGLSALSGVLDALEHNTGMVFKWGLPKFFLGVTLTWPVNHDLNYSRRRTSKCRFQWAGRAVEVSFPSWSWVGWVGPVMFQELFGAIDSEHAGLEFYEFIEDGSLVRIAQNETFRDRILPTDYRPRYSSNPTWKGDTKREVTLEDIPQALRTREIRPLLLVFWTSLATLTFNYTPEYASQSHFIDVWQGSGEELQQCRMAWNYIPALVPGLQSAEFLIVGRSNVGEFGVANLELVAFMSGTIYAFDAGSSYT